MRWRPCAHASTIRLFHQRHPRISKTTLSSITSGARTQPRVCDGGDREQAWRRSISATKGDFRPRTSPNFGSMELPYLPGQEPPPTCEPCLRLGLPLPSPACLELHLTCSGNLPFRALSHA